MFLSDLRTVFFPALMEFGNLHQFPVSLCKRLRAARAFYPARQFPRQSFRRRQGPGFGRAPGQGNIVVQGRKAGGVIPNAVRSIERDRLKRSHERPAPPQAVPHRAVDVRRAGVPLFIEGPGLVQKRPLQTIENKTLYFPTTALCPSLSIRPRSTGIFAVSDQGAGKISTTGTRCGGLTGCTT